ncbi:MAG: DUF4180 domain-containing protein [Bacteroidetes bacterium]|nr:DUF4180 domain-containing protein [Bacteroidota bacterium]
MNVIQHELGKLKIAELVSDSLLISNQEDGIELVGNIYYQGFDKVILYEKNITPDFFDLKTGLAGEVLQKFSNYRIGLAIVGQWELYTSKSMIDFIYESNQRGQVIFVDSLGNALELLGK